MPGSTRSLLAVGIPQLRRADNLSNAFFPTQGNSLFRRIDVRRDFGQITLRLGFG